MENKMKTNQPSPAGRVADEKLIPIIESVRRDQLTTATAIHKIKQEIAGAVAEAKKEWEGELKEKYKCPECKALRNHFDFCSKYKRGNSQLSPQEDIANAEGENNESK